MAQGRAWNSPSPPATPTAGPWAPSWGATTAVPSAAPPARWLNRRSLSRASPMDTLLNAAHLRVPLPSPPPTPECLPRCATGAQSKPRPVVRRAPGGGDALGRRDQDVFFRLGLMHSERTAVRAPTGDPRTDSEDGQPSQDDTRPRDPAPVSDGRTVLRPDQARRQPPATMDGTSRDPSGTDRPTGRSHRHGRVEPRVSSAPPAGARRGTGCTRTATWGTDFGSSG
jgi:hypothetical protein